MLINGDCLEEMKKIESGSVDMILTDPPYGTVKGVGLDGWSGNKTDWDETISHHEMLSECNRVLRHGGAMVLFCQDPYTGKLMTETHGNLPFSYRMTWLKDHFANALIAKKAPVNYTEDICVFFKKYDLLGQHPLREYAKTIAWFIGLKGAEISTELGHQRADHFFRVESTQFGLCTEKTYLELVEKYCFDGEIWFISFAEMQDINRRFNRRFNLPENSKFKSNVLSYKKDYEGLHPTQKPIELMKDLVKTYSNENETILDFTMGSGTTGAACKTLNRKFIGIELDENYFNIAKERIENTVAGLAIKCGTCVYHKLCCDSGKCIDGCPAHRGA